MAYIKKMINHKISFVDIMDVYAFRVVVQSKDDCYRALGVIHGLYKPLPGKVKDRIAIPKSNGFQTLSTVLFGPYGAPVEIQICTQIMEQTANKGVAAHWLYKNGKEVIDAVHIQAQQWINNVIEMQKNASSSSEFFENLKVDLFPDRVFVFTPKGDIWELPRGSTIVDLAYAIHTDIGSSCVAAKVNKIFLPLSTLLLNGQTVDIVRSESSVPKPEWLNFVITSKAQHSIRHYLKEKNQCELIALGKQLLKKAIGDLDLKFEKNVELEIDDFVVKTRFKTTEALYEDIGVGNQLAVLVAYCLSNVSENKGAVDIGDKPLLIKDAEGVAISFCDCCCPIPGDPIVGYLSAGCGLHIHTEDCIDLDRLRNKEPEKYLLVNWSDDVEGEFQVAFDVEAVNEDAAIHNVSGAVLKANASICKISGGESSSDYAFFSIYARVKNLSHFDRVKRYVSREPLVIGVMRKRKKLCSSCSGSELKK